MKRFTADASHELRTPLTALKGQISVILSQPRTSEDYQSALHDMEREVDRLIRLSSDLLFMARFDRANRRVAFESIELATLLSTIVDQVTPLASKRDLTIATDLAPDLNISGDMDLLIRLFMNLLDNAIKYTPSAGTITVSARRQPGQTPIHISIHNTGAHIPADHMPSLFDRFYRVESDRARSLDSDRPVIGAGLGLAIVQEIVETHNGRISVSSTPETGVTFTIELPAV
jgi:signal transduction histidine kinase